MSLIIKIINDPYICGQQCKSRYIVHFSKWLFLLFLLSASFPTVAQDSLDNQKKSVQEDNSGKGLKDKIRNLGIGRGIKKTKDNVAISVALQQAKTAENQQNYLSAIKHYQKVVDLYADRGDQLTVTKYAQHIALLYQKAGRTKQALDQYENVLERKEMMGDTTDLSVIRRQLGNLYPTNVEVDSQSVKVAQFESLAEDAKPNPVTEESDRLKSLAESTEDSQDFKRSLEYYKLYTELVNQQKDEEQAQQMALQEKTFQIERQAQQMSLLETRARVREMDLAQQEEQLSEEQTFRQNLFIGIIALALVIITIFFLYRGKKKALGALNQAYDDLSNTKDRLEDAEVQLKNLLGQQVSKGIAHQLINSNKTDQAQKIFVCVMFLDIRGFTPFAEQLEPEELIKYQNDVFGLMINIIDHHKGVINQFLGDGFMATFGLEDAADNVCENAYNAALEIIKVVNEKSDAGDIPKTRVGIGLHAGKVVAGNVGTDIRKQFSITGNTVITAARIEQLNKKFKSQLLISREVFVQLDKHHDLPQEFVKVEVKGRKNPVELLEIA